MKIRVIKPFKDLNFKGKMRKLNQILEVTEERAKEIIKKGYAVEADYIDIVALEEEAKEEAKAKEEEVKEEPKKKK